MRIEYSNGPDDQLAHYLYLNPKTIESINEARIKDSLLGGSVLGLAAVILFANEELALGYIISAFAVYFIFRKVSSKKRIRNDFIAEFSKLTPQEIRLELSEDGMTEYVDEVVSFVPWHKVRKIEKKDSTYFIELPSSHWAIIPEAKIKSTEFKIEELIDFMKSKGVKEVPNQSCHTTPASAPR